MKPGEKVLSLAANQAWAKRIYQKLLIVVPDLWEIGEYAKSRVEGYMDLNLDVLIAAKGYRRIA